MDALTAIAVLQRQDGYAVPLNYIGPPGRCQRITQQSTLDRPQSPFNHPSSLGSIQPDFMRINRKFKAR